VSRKKKAMTDGQGPSGFLPLLECSAAWYALHRQFLVFMEARSKDPLNVVYSQQINQTLASMEELESNYLALLDEYFISNWGRLQALALAKMIAEESAPPSIPV
jgi:hypothetical protein